jgi:protein-tyrosine phosphatase
LLVLCYGNIYRSPFVEALLRAQLETDVPAMEIRSAGFHRRIGRETPSDFVALSRAYQVDLTGHRSALVERATLDWADLVVVMDRHNWEALADFGPLAQGKAVWLGALLEDGSVEIADPYGRTAAEAGVIAQRLYRACGALAQQLRTVLARETDNA